MGRQIGFFTLREDDDILLGISDQNGMRAIPKVITTGAEVEPAAPLSFGRPDGRSVFYLLPAAAPLEAVVYEQTVDPSQAVLIPSKSAVVEFITSGKEGGSLHNGRIYFDTHRSNTWLNEVRRDFGRLGRVIKGWPSTDRFQFHIGPAAMEAVRSGGLHLRHMKHELHPAER
jgi:hypothetical protein